MARRYRKRKFYPKRRRTYKKRSFKRRYGPRNQIVSLRNPIATRAIVKLRYAQQITLNATTGGVARNIFSANGLYDPDVSGIGHQPLGFDQWMQFYSRYVVIGAKCSAWFANGSVANATGLNICGILLRDSTGSIAPAEEIMEQGYSNYKFQGTFSSGQSVKRVTKTFSAKKWFGIKDVMDNDDLYGTAVLNPNKQAYFHIYSTSQNVLTDPQEQFVNVIIEYLAVLTDPNNLARS